MHAGKCSTTELHLQHGIFFFVVLGSKLRASSMLSDCSIIVLYT
jgi:hypothetical protein